MNPLRYISQQIVWQEVPGEVSLAYTIAGCPLRCPGCHSSDTWAPDQGYPLTASHLEDRLRVYKGLITCVLFLGGEWQMEALVARLSQVRQAGLNTCLYTGLETVPSVLCDHLTYLKTGPWIAAAGGLESPDTNQRFWDLRSGHCLNALFQGAHHVKTD